MKNNDLFSLNKKNIHVSTNDGRYFTGYANVAGEYVIIGVNEYLVHYSEISTIREV
jgi:hypothetical protein